MAALASIEDLQVAPGTLPPQSGYSSHVNAFKFLYQTVDNAVFACNFHIVIIHLSYLQEENFLNALPDWDFSFSLNTFARVNDDE